MPKTPHRRGKRGRSPTNASRHGRTLHNAVEPHLAPCGCPASREVHLLEARVAELEAELKRTTALLTDAFHDDPDVQTLRRRMAPAKDGHQDTYAAAALRSVWQARLSDGFLGVVREALAMPMVECVTVDPAVTVSWCVPHAVVPSVVAARVVAPFTAADVAFIGDVDGIVCVNDPAAAPIESLHALLGAGCTSEHALMLEDLLCKLCAVRLPKDPLARLANALARSEAEDHKLLAVWCQFRAGAASLDTLLAQEWPLFPEPLVKTVLHTQLAVDEFFLPVARVCTPAQVDDCCTLLNSADMNLLATVEFRDQFFTRLANTPGLSEDEMVTITSALTKHAVQNPNVFLEPQFLVDFCARGLRVVDGWGDSRNGLMTLFASLLSMAAVVEEGEQLTSFAQAARDSFFIPAVDCVMRRAGYEWQSQLTVPLREIMREPSSAALFCDADFRDRFLVALSPPLHQCHGFCAWACAKYFAQALANIAATAPLAQRQALFATEEFRDTVMKALVRSADPNYPRAVAAVRAALVCIAVNDDGSLHEVFAHDDDFRCLASKPPSGRWAPGRDHQHR